MSDCCEACSLVGLPLSLSGLSHEPQSWVRSLHTSAAAHACTPDLHFMTPSHHAPDTFHMYFSWSPSESKGSLSPILSVLSHSKNWSIGGKVNLNFTYVSQRTWRRANSKCTDLLELATFPFFSLPTSLTPPPMLLQTSFLPDSLVPASLITCFCIVCLWWQWGKRHARSSLEGCSRRVYWFWLQCPWPSNA